MSKIDLFSEETLKQFEGFGLSKEDVWRLPKEELEAWEWSRMVFTPASRAATE